MICRIRSNETDKFLTIVLSVLQTTMIVFEYFFVTRAGVTGGCGAVLPSQGFFVFPLFGFICYACSWLFVCTSPAIAYGLHAV